MINVNDYREPHTGSSAITPTRYAQELLLELGLDPDTVTGTDERNEATLWAESGAQSLTGDAKGEPLSSPAPLAVAARGCWLALAALGDGALDPDFPAHQLLGERAALLGLGRQGAISAGGACRLLPCADGHIAINLVREDDWRLAHAWLQSEAGSWDAIAAELEKRRAITLIERARMLGLAASLSQLPSTSTRWFHSERLATSRLSDKEAPLVVDLSSLWAGPLCTRLLGELGARVIKVESRSRPDGARNGPAAFFDLLNCSKESVLLDLDTAGGQAQLARLLEKADIVVESARPRGLQQMGIHAEQFLARNTGQTWLSITGYGRKPPMENWVAYGDDAGVAAGLSTLCAKTTGHNVFVGDAIADPLTGLHAALLAYRAWRQGGGLLLDVTLAGVIGRCIDAGAQERQECGRTNQVPVAAPRARTASSPAPAAGSDTATVLAEFGVLARG